MNEQDLDELKKAEAEFANRNRKPFRPLRVWPAAVLVVAAVLIRFVVPWFIEEAPPMVQMISIMGPMLCSLFILLWWIFASRASWGERIIGVAGIGIALSATFQLADSTMRGPAPMLMVTVPMGLVAFAIGAILLARTLGFRRTVLALFLAACGFGITTLLRIDGMTGSASLELHWRWTPSSEDRLLAERESAQPVAANLPAEADWEQALVRPAWPGFRGPDRTGSQSGPPFATDWSAKPPKQLWKITVGPAWSSFAVAGKFLFTQEQRGAMETVVCYDGESGREVWVHSIESRFEESLGGPGPRATPTLSGGGLFVTGAEGWLLRLDPRTGEAEWKTDLREMAGRQPPTWGFSSSPLVAGSTVIVHAGGADGKGTLGFDSETGRFLWSAAAGDHSYSSPQLGIIGGEAMVMMLTNEGLDLLDPADGAVRLKYDWKISGYRALQPRVVDGDTVLLPSAMSGTRRVRVTNHEGTLAVEELWTSRDLKPDFNDFVVYRGAVYGFDGAIFASIDLETGDRNWKGGRYGKGQVLLLEDSGLLLITGEWGEVMLVRATPEELIEVTRFKALEGKTWNHPVLVGDRLYLRNAQEAACYQLELIAEQ